MAKEKRKHDGLLCFLLALIVVLILVIGGGAYYFLVVDNENESIEKENINISNSTTVESTIKENEVSKENIQNNDKVNPFLEFAIIRPENTEGENIKSNIVAKDKNNNWQEIIQTYPYGIILGVYNNKLYYTEDVGINYIDLTKTPYAKTEWIKYKKIQVYENVMTELAISKATMIDDTIYFEYDVGGYGIQALKTSDKSIEDAKQVVKDVYSGKWEIDTNNKQLYYVEWKTAYINGETYNDLAHSLFKYDLETEKKEIIIEGLSVPNSENTSAYIIKQATVSFALYSNKILCLVSNQATEKDANGYYPMTYSLHLYDTVNKKDKIINTSNEFSMSGSLWSYAEYYNNDVYYKSGNNIIKYNNGNNDVIYTYTTNDGGEYFYGFEFIDNNIIELILQSSPRKYLINGKVQNEISNISKIAIKMLDGTTQEIPFNKIEK